jgi:Xaa-Pro aminopeptidase
MKYQPLNPELFINNRKRFVEKMGKQSIAIFNSNDELPSNADQTFKFKQNSDLFWLTGIEQEDTMLILFPDNPDANYKEVLVLLRPNEVKEKWDGHRLRKMKPKKLAAFKQLFGWICLMVRSNLGYIIVILFI